MMRVVCVHTGAAWGGLSTASYISAGGDFPGKIIVQYLAYFLGESPASVPFLIRDPLASPAAHLYSPIAMTVLHTLSTPQTCANCRAVLCNWGLP